MVNQFHVSGSEDGEEAAVSMLSSFLAALVELLVETPLQPQVRCDWWITGHVMTILICDWSSPTTSTWRPRVSSLCCSAASSTAPASPHINWLCGGN